MTGAAWGMLIVTWTLVITFTSYFFLKVVRIPIRPDEGEGDQHPTGPAEGRGAARAE